MRRYRNRLSRALGAAAWLFCQACGLVDLRPVTVEVYPANPGVSLPSRKAALSVGFSAEPRRLEAERAFSVISQDGSVEGDYTWDGNGFSWTPVAPWDPGIRYRLVLRGTIATVDGREARPEIDIPFYCLRDSGLPTLLSFSPADGASVGVGGSGEATLELRFSEPMDEEAFSYAFSLRPSVDFSIQWNEPGTIATIETRSRLSPCAAYSWTVSREARARGGAPLARTEGAGFRTDLDATAPTVERVYPVLFSGGRWGEAADDLSGVESGHSLAIRFSEALEDGDSYSGIRVEPGQPGRVERASPRLIVFTPDRGWEPEKALTLIVPAGVRDESGLGTALEHRVGFTPVTPFLEALRVTSAAGEGSSAFAGGAVLAVTVGASPEGAFMATLRLSASFDARTKVEAVERISLSAFFPSTLPSPGLKSASWDSDDTLTMTWEGLRRSDASSTNYYSLRIPGGPGGVKSARGLYLRDDASIYLEAKP